MLNGQIGGFDVNTPPPFLISFAVSLVFFFVFFTIFYFFCTAQCSTTVVFIVLYK